MNGLPIVGELLMGPAADVEDPSARPFRLRPGAHHLDRLLARLDAVEAQLLQPGVPGAEQMHVVVDQPGSDRLAPEIDPPGVRPGQPGDLLVGADRHDAVAADRHRLRDREAIVDRDDLPVRQDQIGWPRRSLWRRPGRRLLRADQRARAGNREQRTDGRDVRGQACHGASQNW